MRGWRLSAVVVLAVLGGCTSFVPTPIPQGAQGACSGLVFRHTFPAAIADPARRESASSTFLCHEGYGAWYDRRTRTALWVVERLTARRLNTGVPAVPVADYRRDPQVDSGHQATAAFYEGTALHYEPLAAPLFGLHNRVMWSQAFYMTNTAPMTVAAQKAWWHLDQQLRAWAMGGTPLYVVSGPLYPARGGWRWIGPTTRVVIPRHFTTYTPHELEAGKMAVPIAYYRALLLPDGRALGYVIPNTTTARVQGVSVVSLERATGFDFWPAAGG